MPSWMNRITGLIAVIVICWPGWLNAAAQDSSPQTSAAPVQQPAETQPNQPGVPPAANTGAQPLPDAPSSAPQNAEAQNRNAEKANTTSNQQPTEPVGTAAAQIGKLKGGPASKPAGAAIAPSKQGRVRSYLLKFGALAGAGVAIGTVYALSHGSPSRPPGAH